MEWKIGEIKQINGEWYQCVKGRCMDCYFSEKRYICKQFITKNFCTSGIIFKKLEKVGEPFWLSCDKLMQRCYYYEIPILPSDRYVYYNTYGKFIDIEIKQNKEDMEEYKMHDAKEDIPEFDKVIDECLYGKEKVNLKPFNLELAKAGKPVCTRDGRKARIICFDAKGNQPIIALVTMDNGEEFIETYHLNGRFNDDDKTESEEDLIMVSKKKEGWINVYKTDCGIIFSKQPYSTKEEAIKNIGSMLIIVDTVKVEWNE